MATAAGLVVCFAWYYTVLSGFYVLYCPVLYVMFINHKLYRKLADTLFALWELYPVALFQLCCNTKLHHYGDRVDPEEKTIIIMNHRTRVDWNYVWIALYHATNKHLEFQELAAEETENGEHNLLEVDDENDKEGILDIITGGSKIKFVLKDDLKNIPGLGWIMQLNFFLYVKRDWREDQLSMSQFVSYYRQIESGYRVVLFPEGTDLSDENRRKSNQYGIANNLPPLDFVLHPRTTGWASLCSQLRSSGLASVYDATVAYDQPAQTEADLLSGRWPKHVHFCFKRYPIEELPFKDEELRIWLTDRWNEKDVSLRMFHNYGNFFETRESKVPLKRKPRSLQTANIGFLFWTFIDIFFTYAMFNVLIFQFWVFYHSLLFVFVTWKFGGFHNIQYRLLKK